jgi:hypothetical protein
MKTETVVVNGQVIFEFYSDSYGNVVIRNALDDNHSFVVEHDLLEQFHAAIGKFINPKSSNPPVDEL